MLVIWRVAARIDDLAAPLISPVTLNGPLISVGPSSVMAADDTDTALSETTTVDPPTLMVTVPVGSVISYVLAFQS